MLRIDRQLKEAVSFYFLIISSEIKSNFHQLNLGFLTVHSDSILFSNSSDTKFVDRLPIIRSAPNTEQLLGIPKLTSGTGNEIASEIYNTLQEWELLS